MGHKIFVSYKYSDNNVYQISQNTYQYDTVRTYVDKLEDYIDNSDNIYKGESDNEDLSQLSEDTIWEKLKDRIYDSTLTIVMISPNMKENKRDIEQWIPWEISYSLKEVARKNINGKMVTSSSNAILGIVLPDRLGSYSYYITDNNCCVNSCRTLHTDKLFNILKDNMFNIKEPNCNNCILCNRKIFYGECSYIISVTWHDFIKNPEEYINRAYKIQNSILQYNIVKEL